TGAPYRRRHPVSRLSDVGGRVGHAGGETGSLHGGDIDDVVAHVTDFTQIAAVFLCKRLQRLGLVTHIMLHQTDTQFRGPAADDRTVATGDKRHNDAAFHEQLQPVAVEYMKAFELLTLRAVPQ